jgi:hypothetical protein
VPLRYRHEYAADFPRGLPASNGKPTQEFPTDIVDECAPRPAQIHQVRAGVRWRDVKRRFLAYSSPSCSPGPRHLAVLATSRLCQGCSHPPRHHPDQAALNSTPSLRRGRRRRSPTSARITAPHGANRRSNSPAAPKRCLVTVLRAGGRVGVGSVAEGDVVQVGDA